MLKKILLFLLIALIVIQFIHPEKNKAKERNLILSEMFSRCPKM